MTTENTVEQTASAPAPVENADPAPADETKASETVNTDTPADAADTSTTESDEKKRNKVPASKRISELTRDKYQLKNENAELRKRLDEIDKRTQPAEPVKPKLADFGSDAEYEAAIDQFYQKKRDWDSTQASKHESEQQETRRKQEDQAKATQKFVADIQREKANYQDIETVMADPAFAAIVADMSEDLINLVQTSDKNVTLAYHLGTHLEEAERIASLPPVRAARELALLESRLEIPKPKTVTNAPPPVKPVTGSSVKERDISDPNLSDAEFNEMRRKQRAARGRR